MPPGEAGPGGVGGACLRGEAGPVTGRSPDSLGAWLAAAGGRGLPLRGGGASPRRFPVLVVGVPGGSPVVAGGGDMSQGCPPLQEMRPRCWVICVRLWWELGGAPCVPPSVAFSPLTPFLPPPQTLMKVAAQNLVQNSSIDNGQ